MVTMTSKLGDRSMSSSSSSIRQPPAQLPQREGKGNEEEETRDWAALPVNVLLAVLGRLDGIDILMGAGHVCRPWRRATREEPVLWRRVDMRRRAGLAYNVDIQTAARAAVSRSAGRCEAFLAEDCAGARPGYDNDFFRFLAKGAPMLKSLRLISCNRVDPERINQAIRKFPLLEEFELSLYSQGSVDDCRISVSEACPLLTRLRLNHDRFNYIRSGLIGGCECKSTEVERIGGLRSLQLFANSISNKELEAILKGCQQLDSLDIRHCFNVDMDDEMRGMCARVKTLRLAEDSMEDYDLQYDSPVTDGICYSDGMNQ